MSTGGREPAAHVVMRSREPRANLGAPTLTRLDLADYDGVAAVDELAVLADVDGPVLEIGCGPARLLAALAARGVAVLGIDVASKAVRLAARRGVPVMATSVFERLPGEGRWPTVLVFDGNIGIGGDPVELLRRCAQLLAPGGTAIVEVDGPGVGVSRSTAELELGAGVTSWFPWARVGVDEISDLACRAGLVVVERRRAGPRWFAWLRRRPESHRMAG